MQEKNIGSVVQIIGPVLDIRFPAGHLPDLLNAIEIERDIKLARAKLSRALNRLHIAGK